MSAHERRLQMVAGIVDAADGITAASVQLARDPHPDRCDQLISRLRATVHACESLRRKMIEEAIDIDNPQ